MEATSLISGKWPCVALFHLPDSAARFNEPRRRLPGAAPRMLAIQHLELEGDGLVAARPPKVGHGPPLGQTMRPLPAAPKQRSDANTGLLDTPAAEPGRTTAPAAMATPGAPESGRKAVKSLPDAAPLPRGQPET